MTTLGANPPSAVVYVQLSFVGPASGSLKPGPYRLPTKSPCTVHVSPAVTWPEKCIVRAFPVFEPVKVPALLKPLGTAIVVNVPVSAPAPLVVPRKLIVTESMPALKLPVPENREAVWLLMFTFAEDPIVPSLAGF